MLPIVIAGSILTVVMVYWLTNPGFLLIRRVVSRGRVPEVSDADRRYLRRGQIIFTFLIGVFCLVVIARVLRASGWWPG